MESRKRWNFWLYCNYYDLNHRLLFLLLKRLRKYSRRQKKPWTRFLHSFFSFSGRKFVYSSEKEYFRSLFKNRITSFRCTFYYVICLFISHFHFSSCLSTRHLSCNLYHNNIFCLSAPCCFFGGYIKNNMENEFIELSWRLWRNLWFCFYFHCYLV